MYSIVLMMALTNNGANPEALAPDGAAKPHYGNQIDTDQYCRRRRRGCSGGCSGYCGGGGYCRGGGCYGSAGYSRGYGRGYAYDYMPGTGGAYAYDQGWNQPNWNQGQMMQDRQSFYAGPQDRDRDMPGRLVVFTHPQARLTIDGTSTQQQGNVREFESPPLRAGKEFTYTLRAEIPGADGQMQTVTRKVNLRPGMVTQTVLDGRNNNGQVNERTRERVRDESRPEEVPAPKERKDNPKE